MKNRRAFTLVELLMVIAIMGLLGTISVGGYRAMQRGMEERGVMENVDHFIRAAYRRAQIDRQPVAVYFWNELLRAETETETKIVVGKAVAVRRAGRLSRVFGSLLYDEFSDLDKERLIVDENDEDNDNSASGSTETDNLIPIYKMNSQSSEGRSLVSQTTKNVTDRNGDTLLSSMRTEYIPCYAYVVQNPGSAGTWVAGDAYGPEFAEIQLPHGYLFGNNVPSSAGGQPQMTHMWFDVSGNSGSGANQGATGVSSVEIYSLRPGPSGELVAQSVATTRNPTEDLRQ